MATKNVSYNEYKIVKTYTVTAHLTIKAVSERHAEDIAEEFDYACGWDSVSFSANDEHITEFDLDVDFSDEGSAEKYGIRIDTTEEDSDCLDDDADALFDVYGEDSDFDYEDIEIEDEETEEETETETDTETDTEEETETETETEEEPTFFDENPPLLTEEPPKVRLSFLAKSDNITWDLTVQCLIDRLKELPPNATITMPMYCTELAIGDVVAYVK